MKKSTVYKIIGWVVVLFILKAIFSGHKDAPIVTAPTKTPKIVETQIVGKGEFSEKIHVTGRIAPTREVTVSTQWTGFIGSISVEAGDKVGSWQTLAVLADTYGLATNGITEANLGVGSALLTQESTFSSLDQALESARLTYEKAQKDYDDVRITTDGTGSTKADIEWQNYLVTQEKTLEGFETTYTNQLQTLQSFLANVIDTGDTLLWVSPQNREGNDSFEHLISAKDSAKKQVAEAALTQLMTYKNWSPDTNLSLLDRVKELQKVYLIANDFLTTVETVLIQSIPGGSFSESVIAWYRAKVDGYQTQYTSISAGIVSFLNSAQTFLATYERDRLSHEKTVANTERNAKTALDLAKKSYETAQRARDIGQRQADQGLSIADLRVRNAEWSSARLVVSAPFSGVIIAKNAEIGTLAVPGTNLFTIGDTSRLIAKTDVGVDQKKYLKVGQNITLDFDGEMIIGKLSSLSAGPDPQTHLYKVEVTLPIAHPTIELGDIVDVLLPGAPATKQPEFQPIVIPFTALKYLGEDTYAVSVMTVEDEKAGTGTIHEREVKIGSMNEDSVTIVSGLSEGERIVVKWALAVDDGDYVQEAPVEDAIMDGTVSIN